MIIGLTNHSIWEWNGNCRNQDVMWPCNIHNRVGQSSFQPKTKNLQVGKIQHSQRRVTKPDCRRYKVRIAAWQSSCLNVTSISEVEAKQNMTVWFDGSLDVRCDGASHWAMSCDGVSWSHSQRKFSGSWSRRSSLIAIGNWLLVIGQGHWSKVTSHHMKWLASTQQNIHRIQTDHQTTKPKLHSITTFRHPMNS